MNAERTRLLQNGIGKSSWKYWGPYLSERQWGTVREDYSPFGNAWEYFSHEQARSRAYRWGEDGIAGLSDSNQRVCLSLAMWNEQDPILKERLFGLTNSEGNHGEDVKEQYFYLDATPSHSYLKMLYKYPQRAFPYQSLLEENRHRGVGVAEYELVDTGVFAENRYFDVIVEYAQDAPGVWMIRVTAHNRGPDAKTLHLIPQLAFRNTWSWLSNPTKPHLSLRDDRSVEILHEEFDPYVLHADGSALWLFTDNETNMPKLWGAEQPGHFKDAFHDRIVGGRIEAVNPANVGTKVGAWHKTEIPAHSKEVVRLCLTMNAAKSGLSEVDAVIELRAHEATLFYEELQASMPSSDERMVQRQAFAGLIWSKQFFNIDIPTWLDGDPGQVTPPGQRKSGRNADWGHLNNADIISMPDKWEYPWYASWDLAFHCIPFALIDAEFAKQQLTLLTREWFMHPNGQIPAYEWAFGDVNPPVHAWSAWRVFQIERKQTGGSGDIEFLERVFHKLMLNFTWWVNRKDADGRNVFQGGFLGLDNIGVFDRSSRLPTGGHLDQSDGTSWMAMYALNLMRIALELALHNRVYEDIATKFFEHFLQIADAMSSRFNSGVGLWDEQDSFYYDVLNLPNREKISMKVRSMVGLIPLFAVETIEPELLAKLPGFHKRLQWVLKFRPRLASLVSHWQDTGRGERRLLSLLRGHRMKRLLRRMLDETEFLSDFGVRAISKVHLENPYVYRVGEMDLSVKYAPGESESGLFGGNSNWRGPIWFPLNFLIIESLQKFHHYYGDEFKIECPTGSKRFLSIGEVADELSRRLVRIFLKDADGKRPVLGHQPVQQIDPLFRDHVPFYEYFHGDTGRGVGASHQTGWTALVAKLLTPRTNTPT